MSSDSEITSDDNKAFKRPLILCGLFVLVIYPLSVPFYYLIGQVLPEWMQDYYQPLSHIYDPLQWLYYNVEWVKEFYDWYEQFFPWWQ